ncbi:MAG: PA14 domain-containing protein [Polyangiaceae bacterium]|nr:PA14 domain-containing protein [Polyangiaceae bacterium]
MKAIAETLQGYFDENLRPELAKKLERLIEAEPQAAIALLRLSRVEIGLFDWGERQKATQEAPPRPSASARRGQPRSLRMFRLASSLAAAAAVALLVGHFTGWISEPPVKQSPVKQPPVSMTTPTAPEKDRTTSPDEAPFPRSPVPQPERSNDEQIVLLDKAWRTEAEAQEYPGPYRGKPRVDGGGLGTLGGHRRALPIVSGVGVFGGNTKAALKGSLCSLPEGTKSLVSIQRCVAEGIMYTNALNISKRRFTSGFPGVSERFQWFALDYVGRFSVKVQGEYAFRLASDDGSLLWVDGKLIVNNDGVHALTSKSNTVTLDQGQHKIRVLYFQAKGPYIALQLFVTPPGGSEQPWSPEF